MYSEYVAVSCVLGVENDFVSQYWPNPAASIQRGILPCPKNHGLPFPIVRDGSSKKWHRKSCPPGEARQTSVIMRLTSNTAIFYHSREHRIVCILEGESPNDSMVSEKAWRHPNGDEIRKTTDHKAV